MKEKRRCCGYSTVMISKKIALDHNIVIEEMIDQYNNEKSKKN